MKTNNIKIYFNYQEEGIIKAIAKDLNTNNEIAEREVKLRHGDKPDKLLGRKYAFKKLMDYIMENNILSNEIVGKLWKQFGINCKQPATKLAY